MTHGMPPHHAVLNNEALYCFSPSATHNLSHGVAARDSTCGPVLAVEAVLEVQFGFSDQVVGAHQVPVVNGHGERGIHRERGLHVEGPKEC